MRWWTHPVLKICVLYGAVLACDITNPNGGYNEDAVVENRTSNVNGSITPRCISSLHCRYLVPTVVDRNTSRSDCTPITREYEFAVDGRDVLADDGSDSAVVIIHEYVASGCTVSISEGWSALS